MYAHSVKNKTAGEWFVFNQQFYFMSHYIITRSGIHKKIDQKQYEAFLYLSTTEDRGMEIDGTYFAFQDVLSISPENEYFLAHPNQRPYVPNQPDLPALGAGGTIRSINHKKGLEALLTGLQKAKIEHEIQTGKPALNIDALIKKVQMKIHQTA